MDSQRRKKINKKGSPSELRQDLVTGEWVVVATSRRIRPQEYVEKDKPGLKDSIKTCPFEDPQASGNAPPVLLYRGKKNSDWSLQVIPNKYPAFSHFGNCGGIFERGIFLAREGVGFHEVIITKDHYKHVALLSNAKVSQMIKAYQQRYLDLKDDKCIKYISIFHNYGLKAGASLPHPHSQLIALPVLPVSIQRSLEGSNLYFRRKGECVHCAMIAQELKDKERIIFENEEFVAFCPFVSRIAFEIRIFPKKHQVHFGAIPQRFLPKFAQALRVSLKALYDGLKNPDYNFFIHTAPLDSDTYPHYHWHMEIIPHTQIWAGFEIGTGIEISTIEPEEAAKYLRKVIK